MDRQEKKDNSNISNLTNLLEKIGNHPWSSQSNIVIFLGNTGSGKTTLVQFLYGNVNELTSFEELEDSGSFTIKDGNDRIGSGTLSKTLLAESIANVNNDIAYYDCPGFEDTRHFNYDLVANYIMKNIITQAKMAKFIFVINYTSLKCGVDRFDFIKLLNHATEFINNIYNYTESIALIVAKVDNEYKRGPNGELKFRSDDIVKKEIKIFINAVKEDLKSNCINYSQDFYKKALVLTDIFLKEYNDNLVNIALFRRPEIAGYFTPRHETQMGKPEILNVINNINFTSVNNYDFAFTISEKSKNCINDMIDEINKLVMKIISDTNNTIINSMTVRLNEFYNEDELNEHISKMILYFKNNFSKLRQSSNMQNFIDNYRELLKEINIQQVEASFRQLQNYCKYMSFLQEISNRPDLKLPFSEWIEPLQTASHLLEQSLIINKFLLEIYNKISTYDIYKKCLTNKNLGSVSNSNFKKFVNLFENINKNNLPSLSTQQYVKINKLLEICWQQPEISSDKATGILQIKSEFFCTSDLSSYLKCNPETKEIHIFVKNTIFVNGDIIEIGKDKIIVIIAPTWQIIGQRKIILDGYTGSSHQPTKAGLDTNGKPGLPGGPGGSFYGIFQNVINLGNLEISANGGRGGRGQDGGDGSPGNDGDPTLKLKDSKSEMRFKGFWDYAGVLVTRIPSVDNTNYESAGQGDAGKDGACGGAGGSGGCNGFVKILGSKSLSNIFVSCRNGAEGIPGSGGLGGKGGRNATKSKNEKHDREGWVFGLWSYSVDKTTDINTSTSYAEPGKACTEVTYEGRSESNMTSREIDINRYIQEYSLFIDSFKDEYRTNKLKKFYDFLNNENEMKIFHE